ncbi:hypothetical protein TNCV_2833531 [Trichonephila clavipes]|uniref:Uncharacterized protein n=1 Tax=Trichonephila inaurata madagascariensis TaxID=2747483 RepID=A0A8X6Y1Y1_9ARAC|nr:hypothetical protein TNCV_2833531 [Trichonephila clavipes]GFY63136.1 hypothetical protein TNIN_391441 [Trichonephila inaurata madagascariensis]
MASKWSREKEDCKTDFENPQPIYNSAPKMASSHAEARSSVDDGLSLPVLWRAAALEGRCRNYVNALCDVRSGMLILPDAYKSFSLS